MKVELQLVEHCGTRVYWSPNTLIEASANAVRFFARVRFYESRRTLARRPAKPLSLTGLGIQRIVRHRLCIKPDVVAQKNENMNSNTNALPLAIAAVGFQRAA